MHDGTLNNMLGFMNVQGSLSSVVCVCKWRQTNMPWSQPWGLPYCPC